MEEEKAERENIFRLKNKEENQRRRSLTAGPLQHENEKEFLEGKRVNEIHENARLEEEEPPRMEEPEKKGRETIRVWEIKALVDKFKAERINFARQLFKVSLARVSDCIYWSKRQEQLAFETIPHSNGSLRLLPASGSSPLLEIVKFHKKTLSALGMVELFEKDTLCLGTAEIVIEKISKRLVCCAREKGKHRRLSLGKNGPNPCPSDPNESPEELSLQKGATSCFFEGESAEKDKEDDDLLLEDPELPRLVLRESQKKVCRICLGDSSEDNKMSVNSTCSNESARNFLGFRVCGCADYHEKCFEEYMMTKLKINFRSGQKTRIIPIPNIEVTCEVCKKAIQYKEFLASRLTKNLGPSAQYLIISKTSAEKLPEELCIAFSGETIVRIGRLGPETDIAFTDKTVSHSHCELLLQKPQNNEKTPFKIFVSDRGSQFGTFLKRGEDSDLVVFDNIQAFLHEKTILLFMRRHPL